MASLGGIRSMSLSLRRVAGGSSSSFICGSRSSSDFIGRLDISPRAVGIPGQARLSSNHVGQNTLVGLLRYQPSPWTTLQHKSSPKSLVSPSIRPRHQHSWSFPHPPRRRFGLLFLSTGAIGFLAYRHLNSEKSAYPPTGNIIPLTSTTAHQSYPTHSATEAHWTLASVINRYILEPLLTIVRFFHLTLLFGPVILSAPMLLIGTPGSGGKRGKRGASGVKVEDDERWGAVWWYGFLVKQMERAGPTFIKLGQWAASRADLFPAALCDLMGKLHSNGDPHSFRHTKRALEKVFERKFEDIFDAFEEKPIGCGAIAQVYRAILKSSYLPESFLESSKAKDIAVEAVGPEALKTMIPSASVAVKVTHPRIHKIIRRDIAIMRIFARVLNALPGMQWLSLPEEVDVFGNMMNQQLDLRVEANNLDRFQKNFAHRGPGVTFPTPIRLDNDKETGDDGPAGAAVLIEEFEDALPLKWFLRNGGGQYDDRIANIGLDAFLNMLLIDNWTHGDLHPGNIMVRFYKPSTSNYLRHLASGLFSIPEPDDPTQGVDSTMIVRTLEAVAHDRTKWIFELDSLAKDGYEPELIFIDAGLVTSLDTTNRKNFLDLFQAVAEFDGYRAGQLMVERCRTPELAIDKETFALKMQHLVLSVKSKTFSLAAIKISDILNDVLTSVRQHHVKMEGDFVNTVISILLLEGIGRQLDPNMDLFKSALPILRQLGRQMGTSDAIKQVPRGDLWAMAKIWVWLEAREIAGSSTVANIDEWIKLDRLTPNI